MEKRDIEEDAAIIALCITLGLIVGLYTAHPIGVVGGLIVGIILAKWYKKKKRKKNRPCLKS